MAGPVVLACDSSSRAGSVALLEGGVLTAEMLVTEHMGHARVLAGGVEQVLGRRGLSPADVDLFVTSVGPGSFTGIRISIALMKGLAFALERPLVGVCSLEALAWPLRGRGAAILAALDARKGEVYGALYASCGTLIEPMVVDPRGLAERAARLVGEGTIVGAGDGALAYADAFSGALGESWVLADASEHVIRASAVAVIGASRPIGIPADEDLEPMYLRRSEAEVRRGMQ